jgi:hypothetical protein
MMYVLGAFGYMRAVAMVKMAQTEYEGYILKQG